MREKRENLNKWPEIDQTTLIDTELKRATENAIEICNSQRSRCRIQRTQRNENRRPQGRRNQCSKAIFQNKIYTIRITAVDMSEHEMCYIYLHLLNCVPEFCQQR